MATSSKPAWGARLRSAAPWLVASVAAIAVLSGLEVQGILVEVARVGLYGWLGYEVISRLFHLDRPAGDEGGS